ncbi:MAG TPA: DNA internalization-related competence protein ComEC/Rec2 [Tissierellaceae bacterium]|nr:DNA internalization-related competence protein ComEC/Rec2 [Tissierellaceae bacterium]
MNRPFTIFLLPLIAGILLSYYFTIDKMIVLFLLFISILGFIYNIVKERNNFKVLILVFFSLGTFITIINTDSQLSEYYDKRIESIGIVDEIISKDEDKIRYIVRMSRVDDKAVNEKIVLNILGKEEFDIGDKLLFNGELRKPDINGNPKLYNYRLNLMTEKIYSTMTIKEYSIRNIDKTSKPIRYKLKDKFTKDIEKLYDKYLDKDNSSLMKSIILGKSFYLEEENVDLYRDLGLAHILAVSGLHIGIISGFFIFIFSRLGIKRRVNILLTLGMLWTYAYVIGFPTSILRANIMITILLYSQIIHEPYDSINSLSFAMFLLLIINPYYLFSIGFQLSFIASFSIIVFTPRINDLFYPINNYISNSLASIIGVQIGIIPIQIYYFNSFNVLSILANLIFIPVLSLALIIAFVMIIFNYMFSYMNILIGPILNFILAFQSRILHNLDGIIDNWIIFSPEIISIVVYYILIFVILRIIDINIFSKDMSKVFVLSLALILVFNLFIFIGDSNTELHFIDVGQGDSLLIRTKNKNYLMDTGGSLFGNFNIGKNITLPYLQKLGVRSLDAVFITHFHEDHCEGLSALIEGLDIDVVFGTHSLVDDPIYEEVHNKKIPYKELKTGDKLKLDNNLQLLVIWPDEDLNSKYSENNMSLVSVLSDSKANILLTGDMEKEVENIISSKYLIDVDIIKVPHHGSNTSSTEDLLESIMPDIGVISLGKNNMYGHPDTEVVSRYEDISTKIYRTDESGLVKTVLDSNGYTIDTYLENGNRKKLSLKDFLYDNILVLSFYSIYYVVIYILLKITYTWSDGRIGLY